jgi:hypothetical protein
VNFLSADRLRHPPYDLHHFESHPEKRVLHKYRLFERWFVVAVDGTGVVSFGERHCEHCLHRTSKTGKTTYFHPVLEAKLITASGLAISLATEWIANPDGEYDKQDCERTALVRLATQLKQQYPRLPLCLTADGLYPSEGFFELCRQNDWAFILTFQDGNLPTVWEDVQGLLPRSPGQCQHERRHYGTTVIDQTCRWLNHLDYRGHTVAWLECVEVVTPQKQGRPPQSRFVHLTNLTVTARTVRTLSRTGRLPGGHHVPHPFPRSRRPGNPDGRPDSGHHLLAGRFQRSGGPSLRR